MTVSLAAKPRGSKKSKKELSRPKFLNRKINLLLLPALLVVLVFSVYPVLRGVALSATNWDGYSPDKAIIGLKNYTRLFSDANFRTALVNTLIYGFGSTIIQQIIGLALALGLDRKVRGTGLARAIIYLPVLVSPVVMGTMYYLFFSYGSGGINDILEVFELDRVPFLANSGTAVFIIVVLNTVQFVGISMVIYLAGLQTIPTMYYEASKIDGASAFQRFKTITVPLLIPSFTTSVVINLIGGLKLFDHIVVLTAGGPGYSTHSVSTLISKTYFDNQNAGYASAMGVVLFLFIAVMTLTLNALFNKRQVDML